MQINPRMLLYGIVLLVVCHGPLLADAREEFNVAYDDAVVACKAHKNNPGDIRLQARCGFAVWYVEYIRRNSSAVLSKSDWQLKKTKLQEELHSDIKVTESRGETGEYLPVIALLVEKAPVIRFRKGTATPLFEAEAQQAAAEYKSLLAAITDEARRHNVSTPGTLLAWGFASSEGPEKLNLDLSNQRAKYLQAQLEPIYDRSLFRGIRAQGFGETKPTVCKVAGCTPANGCNCGGQCEAFEAGYAGASEACENKVLARRVELGMSF